MRITAEQRSQFWADGVVMLEDALDPAAVMALAPAIENAIENDCTDLGELSSDSVSRSFFAGVDHHRTNAELAAFEIESPLARLVAEILAVKRLHLYEDSVLVKEPRNAPLTEMHQDLAYFGIDGPSIATCWVPLDQVDPVSGAVRYVIGSHRWQQMGRPNLFVDPTPVAGTEGRPIEELLAEHPDASVVSFETGPGDVVIHHALTIHGAFGNRSPRRRRALSVRYCGDDSVVRHRPGTTPKPHHVSLSPGDPVVAPHFPLAHTSTRGNDQRRNRRS